MQLIKKLLFVFAFISGISSKAIAQHDFCNSDNTSFQVGEKVSFKVFYNMGAIWLNAGEAHFTIEDERLNGHKVYHITGDGQTLHSHDWIFKVRDKYETYIDKKTLLPVKFLRNVNEGGYVILNDVSFDQENGKASSSNVDYNIPKCTQDILSAIYFARNINYDEYEPGDKIPFNLFLDDKVYSLYIRYLGKEQITTKFGTFNAIKIAPMLIKGTIFKGGEKMRIWVSDDKNHIPLRINSPILVGSIKVDLMEYDNLRYPFKGLITEN